MAGKFPTGLVIGLVAGGVVGYAAGSNSSPSVRAPAPKAEMALTTNNLASADVPAMPASGTSSTPAKDAPKAAVESVVEAKPEADPSDWHIADSVEAMTDKPIRHACATSTNKVSLGFPYGDRGAQLCIRKHPTFGQDVYVTLDGSGQILCASYDGCTVRVRFDDGEVQGFSANGPSDNSSETVFLSNDNRFIAAAKKAARIRVQLEFYQNGVQTFDFPARGLKW